MGSKYIFEGPLVLHDWTISGLYVYNDRAMASAYDHSDVIYPHPTSLCLTLAQTIEVATANNRPDIIMACSGLLFDNVLEGL